MENEGIIITFLAVTFVVSIFALLNTISDPLPYDNDTLNISYAEIFNYTDHNTPWLFNITKDNTYYNITNLEERFTNRFTFTDETQENGGSYLTALEDGIYKIDFSMSFTSNNVGGTFAFAIVENFTLDKHKNCYARREATTDIGNVGITCFLNLTENSIINIQVENEDSTRDIIVHTIDLNLIKIGDI